MANNFRLQCKDVYNLLWDILNGMTTVEVSEKYNVSRGTINNIVYERFYSHCGFKDLTNKVRQKMKENYSIRWRNRDKEKYKKG